MTLKDDERRNAPRFALPKSAHATFGGFAAEIVEVSLIGCQIQHVDRIAPRARLPLRFKWRGTPVRIDAMVMRSEMRSTGGKPAYLSGLAFCETAGESPAVIRDIVGWLAQAAKSAMPEDSTTQNATGTRTVEATADDDADVVSAPYLQCRLTAGTWDRLYVEEPAQPPDGFTIVAPPNDAEVNILCRSYEAASAQKRREMRASFERAIAQSRKRSG